jgi:hypothetical protein
MDGLQVLEKIRNRKWASGLIQRPARWMTA